MFFGYAWIYITNNCSGLRVLRPFVLTLPIPPSPEFGKTSLAQCPIEQICLDVQRYIVGKVSRALPSGADVWQCEAELAPSPSPKSCKSGLLKRLQKLAETDDKALEVYVVRSQTRLNYIKYVCDPSGVEVQVRAVEGEA